MKMINPIQTWTMQPDGTKRFIIIEPILQADTKEGIRPTQGYRIFKDAFGDQTRLFTEPIEINDVNTELEDDRNPDYLGQLTFISGSEWKYDGDLLSKLEQQAVADHITAKK